MESTHFKKLTHAIVVAGHAVYHGGIHLSQSDVHLDKYWALQSFQTGEPPFYIEHIRAGVELCAAHDDSLLIFSGGQTRPNYFTSEAQGYYHVAEVFDYWGWNIRSRVTTEEFARDSYDNVIFGIARFCEYTGALPKKLSIISWSFKEERFRFHVQSAHWPLERYRFIPVGNPYDLEKAKKSCSKTLAAFKTDVTGSSFEYNKVINGSLGEKKMSRNPYKRFHAYAISCPQLAPLLTYTDSPVPPNIVPWTC